MGKHDKEIELLLKKYFENTKNIEELAKSPNPQRALYELAEKLSAKFCLAKNINTTDLAGKEVFNKFGQKIEKASESLHLIDGFNFDSESKQNRLKKI